MIILTILMYFLFILLFCLYYIRLSHKNGIHNMIAYFIFVSIGICKMIYKCRD